MRSLKWILVFIAVASVVSLCAGELLAERPSKAPKRVYVEPEESFGYRPPPVDISGLRPVREALGTLDLPASWDWRALGGVTSVKNQNPYGTCWAFGALGDLESKVLLHESAAYDYSEVNIVACVPQNPTCNTGGNAWMTTNYLALLGSVYEACNPYPGGCPTPACVNPACPYLKRVTEWRVIPNDVTAIKTAVMTYGPVYTSMYASFPGFSTYNGTTCLVYTGTETPNHAVLIVGWDDSMCSGVGAWIVKNSWGTSWGAAGYFYIRYGSASIGMDSSVLTAYKAYDATETILYYDEWGWWSSLGYGDEDDYGMVAFTPSGTPPEGDLLRAVDFWAVYTPFTYTIEIYDTFSGGALSNLLAGPFTGMKAEAGYYSYPLPAPLTVYTGNTIYIKMRFQTPGYDWPIPFDDSGPMETDKCYVSDLGTVWEAVDLGSYGMGDIGIRARITPRPTTGCSMEGDPALRYGFGYLDGLPYNQPGLDYAEIYAGQTLTYELGPYNASTTWLPLGVCDAVDTLCFTAISKSGWTVSGDPPLGEPVILGPGYIWYNFVSITAPCSVTPCDYDTLIAYCAYVDGFLLCRPDCGDCADNIRPGDGLYYYNADTLIIHVIESPPALGVLQDTLSYVERGQTAAYVPFAVCNQDECAPPTTYGYNIKSRGHIGEAINATATIAVAGGECGDVYGIINAGSSIACTYDTLTIIVWTTAAPIIYDTCVQVIHVIEPTPVPLMSPLVIAILVLALILIASIFLRRRMRPKE